MKKEKPAFTFFLHTHLPYVLYHGTWPHGTDWLYEAGAECYLPLLDAFNRLNNDGIKSKVTIDLSPVLTEQLANPKFKIGLNDYLIERISAAEKDHQEFHRNGDLTMHNLAVMWRNHYKSLSELFNGHYGMDIPGAFRKLEEDGAIEIITCAATHGYLPLLGTDNAITAQLKQGVSSHISHFGRTPRGIWLPECAYRPGYLWKAPVESEIPPAERDGLEKLLAKEDLRYFIVDTDLLKGGEGVDVYLDRFPGLRALWERMEAARSKLPEKEHPRTHHRPYWVGGDYEAQTPVAVFVRDPDTALVVWSGEHGYPGDGNYLEFHKKRFPNGHRYWRVTSSKADLAEKMVYNPDDIDGRLSENAEHFSRLVERKLAESAKDLNVPPFLAAPFDTELFGHWWFEGPRWIEMVLRSIHSKGEVELCTAGEYLKKYPPDEAISMPEGSWGQGGFHWIWLNDDTKWTWNHLYKDELRMKKLVSRLSDLNSSDFNRVMKQLGRELLLAQSSDWQFLISTFSAKDYAEARFAEHQARFDRIAEMAEKIVNGEELRREDWSYLSAVEESDSLFADIDPKIWLD